MYINRNETTAEGVEKKRHGKPEFPIAAYYSDTFGSVYHHHPEYEFVYVSRGHLTVTVNDDTFVMHDGDIIFIDSDTPHYIDSDRTLRGSGSCYFAIVFHPDIIGRDNDYCYSFFTQNKPQLHISSANGAGKLIYRIYELIHQCNEKYNFRIKSLLFELLGTITAAEESAVPPYVQDRELLPQQIVEFIHEHYSEKITIDMLSEHFGLSGNSLSRAFKKAEGCSIISFLNNYRIQCVCSGLIHTPQPIANIAQSCGFTNISNFNRLFFKTMGRIPSEYRILYCDDKVRAALKLDRDKLDYKIFPENMP